MPVIHFTSALKRFYPDLASCEISVTTIADMMIALDKIYPGISSYIVDENSSLRKHVNIFIGDEMIRDRNTLSDIVRDKDEIHIIQALSGG